MRGLGAACQAPWFDRSHPPRVREGYLRKGLQACICAPIRCMRMAVTLPHAK